MLPTIPTWMSPTEDRVSRLIDRADKALLSNQVTEEAYHSWFAYLDLWADPTNLRQR